MLVLLMLILAFPALDTFFLVLFNNFEECAP